MPRRDNYRSLRRILLLALEQARNGKGKERHNPRDLRFTDQEIVCEARVLGMSAPAFQVRKKARESVGLVEKGNYGQAKEDILGAMVYLASMYIITEEQERGVMTYVEKDAV